MKDSDFDRFRETRGDKCSVRIDGARSELDGILAELDETAEIVLGGTQAQTLFVLRLKKSALMLAGIPDARALPKKTIRLFDEKNGFENRRFVVLSARSHPAGAVVRLTVREA